MRKDGCPENIDPRQVVVGVRPKRRRKPTQRKREPVPDIMKPWAEGAKRRKNTRPISPGVMLEPQGEGQGFLVVSPHDDDEAWENMVADAFGTRSWGVIRTFFDHLRSLTSQAYDHENECWKPNETELNAALAIIHATKPKDELDAMLLAQAVATHWMQMKASAWALRQHSGMAADSRTAGSVAKLSRAFVNLVQAIDQRKRKPRSTRQTITVKKENHYHQHKHVHLEGGAAENGEQGHAADGTEIIEGSAQVPGHKPGGQLLRLPVCQGEESVPDARRSSGKRGAQR